MTDYQILTIIAAFVIVDIAVLSLVAIPLLRRRLSSRGDNTAPPAPQATSVLPSDPLATAASGRLSAAIGSRPTLSAPVPTIRPLAEGAIDPDDLPIGAAFAETDENEVSGTEAGDVVDAIAAARAATEALQHSNGVPINSDDAQDEAQNMDSTEMSVARARGFAIHPEDPLVASTIDRLLGARRDATVGTPIGGDAGAPAEGTAATGPSDATGAAETAPTDAGETAETEPAEAAGSAEVHIRGDLHVITAAEAPAEPDATAEPGPGAGPGRPVMAAGATSASTAATVGFPEPTIDPETGLDSPLSWAMAVTIEEARSGRYGRPVSVVIAELDGLDRLSELFGADVADRVIPPVADALRRSARAADRVARLSRSRFGVLLVETDEIRAINYVERVRSACDRWLESSAIALRLSIGWASPATDGDLRSAVRIAEERMHREQHRPAPWRPAATTASSTTTSTTTTTTTTEG